MGVPDGGLSMSTAARATWIKIGGLWVLLFLATYVLVALESSQISSESSDRRTTYSAEAGGYKALYLWLGALKIPVRRWERRLGDLPAETSVLLMVEPELGSGSGELELLKEWIANGGTFVLIASRPNMFLESMKLELESVFGMHHGDDDNEGFLFQPGPYTQGVRSLHSNGHPGLASPRPQAVVHIKSSWGGLLLAIEKGKGRVIALADPDLLCNESLRDGDHGRLALNILLSHLGNGTLLIDEYHHGYGRAISVMQHFVRSRALVPTLQGILFLLVLWAAKGRRFGPTRPVIQEQRRSSLEYVRAMAHLYQRARARALAFEVLIRWIEDQAKKILVFKDGDLQSKLLAARRRLDQQEFTEKELLRSARGLYVALDEARRRAEGNIAGSKQ